MRQITPPDYDIYESQWIVKGVFITDQDEEVTYSLDVLIKDDPTWSKKAEVLVPKKVHENQFLLDQVNEIVSEEIPYIDEFEHVLL